MGIGTAVAWIGANASAIGAGVGAAAAVGGLALQAQGQAQQQKAAKKSRNAQRQQVALNERRADIRNANERRKAFRANRINQARAGNVAFAGGGGADSSFFAGASGAAQSALGRSIGFAQTLQTLGDQSNILQQELSDQRIASQEAISLGNLGGTIFGASDRIGQFAGQAAGSSLFSAAPSPTTAPQTADPGLSFSKGFTQLNS